MAESVGTGSDSVSEPRDRAVPVLSGSAQWPVEPSPVQLYNMSQPQPGRPTKQDSSTELQLFLTPTRPFPHSTTQTAHHQIHTPSIPSAKPQSKP